MFNAPITASRPALPRVFDEWLDYYSNRSYTLARLSMLNATEDHPRAPEAWFLLGLTELAGRDFVRAKESFRQAAKLLDENAPLTLRHEQFRRLREVLPPIQQQMEARTLTTAPPQWDAWLRDPASLSRPAAGHAGQMLTPLGRTEPLLKPPDQPLGSYTTRLSGGVLGSQLKIDPIRVDSMKSLLGRDAKIHIDRDPIVIQQEIPMQAPRPPQAPQPYTAAPPFQSAPNAQSAPAYQPAPKTELLQAQPRPQVTSASPAPPAPPKPASKPFVFQPAPSARPAAPVQEAARQSAAQEAAEDRQLTDAWADWERQVMDLVARGKSKDAFARIDEALRRYPDSSRLLEFKAGLLEQTGRRAEAAHAYAETYRKAAQAGSQERAQRSFRNAMELARENGDLLFDMAGMAASLGSIGLAVGATKLAADVYRRRNDRPKLAAALRRLLELEPNQASIRTELSHVESELRSAVGQKVGQLKDGLRHEQLETLGRQLGGLKGAKEQEGKGENEDLFEIVGKPSPTMPAGGESEPYGRTRPPGAGGKRRHPEADEMRRRAMNAPTRSDKQWPDANSDIPQTPLSQIEPGGWMLMAALLTFFLTFAWGFLPALVGYVVTHKYVKGKEARGLVARLAPAKAARAIFLFSLVIGVVRSIVS